MPTLNIVCVSKIRFLLSVNVNFLISFYKYVYLHLSVTRKSFIQRPTVSIAKKKKKKKKGKEKKKENVSTEWTSVKKGKWRNLRHCILCHYWIFSMQNLFSMLSHYFLPLISQTIDHTPLILFSLFLHFFRNILKYFSSSSVSIDHVVLAERKDSQRLSVTSVVI